jgi:transposase
MAEIEIKKDKLQEMINTLSIAEVAKVLGVTKQTVYNLVRRHGLDKPDRMTRVVVID